MRRPRRWSGAASWTSAFAFAVKSVNEIPIAKRTTPGEDGVLHRREREREDAEAAAPDGEEPPARLAERRRGERADERAEPERGGEEAEALGPHVERVGCQERHEHVEVEADGRDDGDDAEDRVGAAGRSMRRRSARRSPPMTRADGSFSTGWSSSSRTKRERGQHGEEADGVQRRSRGRCRPRR